MDHRVPRPGTVAPPGGANLDLALSYCTPLAASLSVATFQPLVGSPSTYEFWCSTGCMVALTDDTTVPDAIPTTQTLPWAGRVAAPYERVAIDFVWGRPTWVLVGGVLRLLKVTGMRVAALPGVTPAGELVFVEDLRRRTAPPGA